MTSMRTILLAWASLALVACQTYDFEPVEPLAFSQTTQTRVIQARAARPELMLLDWELPGRAAAALLFALHGLTLPPRVIILSSRPEAERAAQAVGADAFVYKGDPPEKLLNACRQVMGTATSGQTGSSACLRQAGSP